MQTPFTSSRSGEPQKFNVAATVRNLLINIVGFGALAVAIYLVCKNILHTSDTVALLLTGVPTIIHMLVGIIRNGKVNVFSGIMLFIIGLSVVFVLLSGNPRLFLLRSSLIPVAIGLAYLVSLLFPRPLFFYLARYFVTGEHPENRAQFDTNWHYPYFRSAMRLITLCLAGFCLVAAAIQIVMILTLSIAVFLAASSLLEGVFYLVLGGWMFLYLRHMLRKLRAMKASATGVADRPGDQSTETP